MQNAYLSCRRAISLLMLFACVALFPARSWTAELRRWAFVGVWDRSMPLVDAACREAGVAATFISSSDFAASKSGDDASRYELVFVLNLGAEDAPAITERLKQSRAANPRQRVLALDKRASQA